MNEKTRQLLSEAEQLIRKGLTEPAKGALEQVLLQTPEEEREELLPRLMFDRGNVALLEGELGDALEMYRRSLAAGSEDYMVPYNMAAVLEKVGEFTLERDVLEAASQLELAQMPRRMIFQQLHEFYLRRGTHLKARRTAERYIEEHDDEYFGRHLLFQGMMAQKQYDEARQLLDEQKERFGADPVYLKDRLDWFDGQRRYEEELQLTRDDPLFMQVIPQLTLQRRLSLCLTMHDGEGARSTARELFVDWGDDRGSFSQMIFAVMDGDFYTAAATADYILKANADHPGMLFYTTLYVDQIILWKLCGGRPTDRQRATMERALRMAMEWFGEHGMDGERLQEPLRRIGFQVEMPMMAGGA